MYTSRVTWETLRSIDSATLSGGYSKIGGPLLFPSYLIKMVNNSSVLVTVSIDGLTDIDVVPPNSIFVYDEAKTQNSERLPANTQVFVKGAAGVGLIYLVSQYLVLN